MSSDGSPAAIAGASLAPIGMPQRRASLSEPQDRLSRSVRWLSQSTRGVRRWIVGLVLAAGICFCVVLNAASDRAAAQDLRAHGQWLVSNDVQVHVAYESTRGGGFWTVDGARASFRGISGEVSLQNVGSLAPLDGESWKEGWQAPTAATGYQTPLSVIVRRDPSGALVTGMAKGDYDYRISGTTVQAVAAYIGTAALALAVLSLPLNRARLRLDARRDAHRAWHASPPRGVVAPPVTKRSRARSRLQRSPPARQQGPFAVGFLVGGRVLIVTVAAAVVICRLTRPVWITAPQDAGPRRFSLDAVRASRLTLPGRGVDAHLLILRDHRHRMVIVWRSTLGRHEPAGASDAVVALRAALDRSVLRSISWRRTPRRPSVVVRGAQSRRADRTTRSLLARHARPAVRRR